MTDVPVLLNAAEVLKNPDAPESKKAWEQYVKAKAPAEELRQKQQQWMRERHGA